MIRKPFEIRNGTQWVSDPVRNLLPGQIQTAQLNGATIFDAVLSNCECGSGKMENECSCEHESRIVNAKCEKCGTELDDKGKCPVCQEEGPNENNETVENSGTSEGAIKGWSARKQWLEQQRLKPGGGVVRTPTGYRRHTQGGHIDYDHEGRASGFEPKEYAHEKKLGNSGTSDGVRKAWETRRMGADEHWAKGNELYAKSKALHDRWAKSAQAHQLSHDALKKGTRAAHDAAYKAHREAKTAHYTAGDAEMGKHHGALEDEHWMKLGNAYSDSIRSITNHAPLGRDVYERANAHRLANTRLPKELAAELDAQIEKDFRLQTGAGNGVAIGSVAGMFNSQNMNKLKNAGTSEGVKKAWETRRGGVPAHHEWNRYAGGTAARADKNSFDFKHPETEKKYSITPISSPHNVNRHMGYHLGVFPGENSGHADIDDQGNETTKSKLHRSPQAAALAAGLHSEKYGQSESSKLYVEAVKRQRAANVARWAEEANK